MSSPDLAAVVPGTPPRGGGGGNGGDVAAAALTQHAAGEAVSAPALDEAQAAERLAATPPTLDAIEEVTLEE